MYARRCRRVYPRACGGTPRLSFRSYLYPVLSPRMRGNRKRRSIRVLWPRSIPAHAGEPSARPWTTTMTRVYPRACGGTSVEFQFSDDPAGLSPRMRGNRVRMTHTLLLSGSIPAHAGEPPAGPLSFSAKRVYPRACGGTAKAMPEADTIAGLSPRMRGNPPGTRQEVAE